MKRIDSVNLGNLVLSLSDAMDLANPRLFQHQQRVAFVVWQLGKAARLTDERINTLFIAALLHDIGALSLEEKISLYDSEITDTQSHCIRGESLLATVPLLQDSAKIVRFHHKEWQDWHETIETPLVFDSQLLHLADYLERSIDRSQYILHQHEDIIAKVHSLSFVSLHPQVVDLFSVVSTQEEFWLDLVSSRIYSLLLNEGPFKKTDVELSNISMIAGLFRNIIDFRSPFTATHSSGVATAASSISKIFGLTSMETMLMEVAGDLHDIGKLAIPNSILEKPGPLTKEEMALMKSHTYYTYLIIKTIGGLQQIAEWAAYHHERLDGSGYPFHCTSDELSTGARIMMVADIFTALAEDRPYRKGMNKDDIVRIMKQFSDRQLLDAKIISILFGNFDEISSHVSEKQAMAKEFYRKQFSFID